jgi:hypothetical protein
MSSPNTGHCEIFSGLSFYKDLFKHIINIYVVSVRTKGKKYIHVYYPTDLIN